MDSKRRLALVHSHIGEHATRLGFVHSHNGEHALRLDEETAVATDDPAPASATETDYVCSSEVWWQKNYAVLDILQRGNTSPALTNSGQEPRCKLRAVGN